MNQGGAWPSTNSSLLLRIREPQDEVAWSTFVQLYTPLIYQFARKRGLQDADAKDVTQEVLTQVAKSIRTFQYDPQRGRFRGWLGKLVRQAIYRHAQKAARAARGAGDDTDAFDPADLEGEADAAWIEEFNRHIYHRALERIRGEFNDESWQAFDLVWLQDRRPSDVAQQLERKVEWVYKAKFKILRRLKQEVEFLAADTAVFGTS